MKYLWLGINLNESIKEKMLACGAKILSGKVSEDNLLTGLDNAGIDMDSINSYRFPVFPKYSQKVVERVQWSRNGKSTDVSVSYLNYKYINQLSRTKSLKKEARAWALKNKAEDVTVFVYSMHSPFMAAAKEVKKVIPNAQIVLIVLDLPQYMDLGMNKVKTFLKKIDWIKIKGLMKSVDKYVLYSKHMATFLNLPKDCWTVMEGSINENDVVEENVEKDKDIVSVMYSGVCNMRYGIPELLDAFALIEDKNFELWITGSGNAVPLIEERAKKDSRIKYYGFLPTRADLLKKQKQATMMINMRKPDEAASAYCFPSKLFEYMLSGNPVLTFNIPGIPEEYFDYLIEMKDTTPLAIAEAIKSVAAMPLNEIKERGEKSRTFVLEQKNKNAQSKKILDFLAKN